ncbi:MAG: glycosyltransferase family 4 protein [Chloroflexi bacterium]|nr:glycosyltransferase family 4 protein [Chloroflexota bacterium]
MHDRGAIALPGSPTLLHVASLYPVKDQATLIRTLPLILKQFPDAHLHVVGKGPLLDTLSDLARTLNCAPHVTFHGEVFHTQMPAYYRAADVHVLSSGFESQSMVTLEAAACGSPTVGTAVGILPDFLPPSCVVPLRDPAALAASLCLLLGDSAERHRWGLALQQRVEQGLSLMHTVSQLERLYLQLL